MIATGNPQLELLEREYASAFPAALRDVASGLEPRLRAVYNLQPRWTG